MFRRRLASVALILSAASLNCTPVVPDPESGPPLPVPDLPYLTLATSEGYIVIELFTDLGTAAATLRTAADEGYYDGTIVHEARNARWLKVGQYSSTLLKSANRSLVNESGNGLANYEGRVAMYGPADTASGVPYLLINLANNLDLDFSGTAVDFTVVGRVIKGLDIAEAMGEVTTATRTAQDGTVLSYAPQTTIYIKRAWSSMGPLADAGADQTARTGIEVTLDGTGSKARTAGQTLTYAWTQTSGPAVELDDPTSATPKFTPPTVATLTFELTVTEAGRDDPGVDEVIITVNAPTNQAPAARAGANQKADGGQTVTLDGSASSDPDAEDTLTFAWTQLSGEEVTLSNATVAGPTFTAPDVNSTLVFQLTVRDNHGGQADDRVSVVVRARPVADAGEDQTVLVGDTVTLDGSGSRPAVDGNTLVYAWLQTSGPEVDLDDPSEESPTFPAESVGTLTFQLTVTEEARGLSSTDTVTITVNSEDNEAPVADAGEDQIVAAGSVVTLDGSGSSDPDEGDELAFTWTRVSGPEVTLTHADQAIATFTAPAALSTLTFRLEVDDGQGGSASDEVTVVVLGADAGEDRKVIPSLVVTLDGSGSDPGFGTLSYLWEQIDGTNVTLNNPATQRASFTVPDDAANGSTLTFQLTVDNGEGVTAANTVTLTVATQPVVRLETSEGNIDLNMLIDGAPITALNFVQYVEDGFYNNTIFHRVMPGFVIQGGGYLSGMEEADGVRDPIVNEFGEDRSNIRGTVAMAKLSGDPDSATSQFFFNLVDNSANLDAQNGGFTVFATVTDETMAVVDDIATVETGTFAGFDDVPVVDVVLLKAFIK